MLRICKLGFALALSVMVLIGMADVRLAAQGTTGTILGTVTDATGGAVPDATVHVTNTGTNANQDVMSDAQGRYRVPDLPVGNYQVSTEKMGFQSLVKTGITLNAGANIVVDFALAVGQVTQSVTVEGNVTQVETTSSAISTVVEPTQMRDLPLNGRDFEELILLAPGVNIDAGGGTTVSGGGAAFSGASNWWSVSGSRPNGQGELLDGTNVQDYQDRGAGSGVLGTTLGIDAIAEFQLLTNTYGAQYGGSGAVVNAVTRSGTNALHGSAYEFLRNDVLDARTFFEPGRVPFEKNQFGTTLGGPIKKDKMFFFANYEGIRQNQTPTIANALVPDMNAHNGIIPGTTAALPNCNGTGAPAGYVNCGPGSTNDTVQTTGPLTGINPWAAIQPFLALYPTNASMVEGTGGQASITLTAPQPAHENYVVGRYDWTLGQSDSLFVRYLFDASGQTDPTFGTLPAWPETEITRNQFATVGEKHVFSTNVINSATVGLTRTLLDLHTLGESTSDALDFEGILYPGSAIQDGTVTAFGGAAAIGPNGTLSPVKYAQNKLSATDSVYWIKGAHSFTIGGSVTRQDSNGLHPIPGGGLWTFASLGSFLTDSPQQFTGPCNYYNTIHPMLGCTQNGVPLPFPSSNHDMRENQYSMYFQDDWKIRPTLTLNLGLRYAPTSNPTDALNQIYQLLPLPFGGNGNQPPVANGTPVPVQLTPTHNFNLVNDSFHNIDPRIGIAWDPFKDHKTSVRAGYGIFHAVVQPRDYSYGAFFSYPWVSESQTTGLTSFPNAFSSPGTLGNAVPSNRLGWSPYNTTPYLQQWNLSVQREVMKNTVVTVSYVGSHGVHLIGQLDTNPPVGAGLLNPGSTGGALGAVSIANGATLWPNWPGENLVCITGTCNAGPAGSIATCASSTCTFENGAGNKPLVDPNTGQFTYAHIQSTTTPSGTTYSVQPNSRLNPNFGFEDGGQTNDWSKYNALEVGVVRRMTNNLSVQISYTYSDCTDIVSGNWNNEGGAPSVDPYDRALEEGPCTFMVRHNLTTNGLYLLPFKGNRLVSGWQLGATFYYRTGAPFSGPIPEFNQFPDIGFASNRGEYVPNQAGCNGQPINSNPFTPAGVFFFNKSCFNVSAPGEVGNISRNNFFGPNNITFNPSLQKNTAIGERFNLQFRAEFFNIFNRVNLGLPGGGVNASGTTSVAGLENGSPAGNLGQINTISGIARQIQFGLKLIF